MADEPRAPKDHLSILRLIFSQWPVLASIVLIALAVWGALIASRRLPQLSHWAVPLGMGTAGAFALAILWKVPQWQVAKVSGLDPKEQFDRVNEARKTLAQIVGGIAVLAGFYSTVQNLKVTQDGQLLAQQSFALAQEGQFTDRFSKAIEQLGAVDSGGKKKLEVRLGGIYGLQRIADESQQDHWPAIQVLSAYVRDNSPETLWGGSIGPKLTTDIQAIVTILRTRNVNFERKHEALDLSRTYLPDADLHGGYLRDARLTFAILLGADLSGADLSGANLLEAALSEADLSGAKLPGANLSGGDLSGAKLPGADLSGADLSRANLYRANLSSANLSSANLSGANLSGANLTGVTNLQQAQIDLAQGNSETRLPGWMTTPDAWRARP